MKELISMQKFSQKCMPLIIFSADFVLVIASFHLSFLLRYGFDIPEVNFGPFRKSFLALGFIYCLAFAFAEMFRGRFRSHWELYQKVFLGMIGGTLFSFLFLYVFRVKLLSFPSSVFIFMVPVGTVLIVAVNIIILRLAKLLVTNLVIVGKNTSEEILVSRSQLNIYRVEHIEEILQYENIDEVLICKHIHEDSQLNLLIFLLNKLKINVSFTPDLYASLLSENIKQKNTLRFLATSLGRKSDLEEFLIRLLDIAGSLVLLTLTAIPMLIISMLIKLSSKGPVFYQQERVGKNAVTFSLYKFRTMIADAEIDTGPVFASERDPRITFLGLFLRKTRLDEFPQLLNILKGEMSLVGPRPERPHFVKLHKALRGIRLAVKPGLTGLAQIKNAYDLHPKHKIKYDYLYIQRRSLRLNIYILINTIPVMLARKGQ